MWRFDGGNKEFSGYFCGEIMALPSSRVLQFAQLQRVCSPPRNPHCVRPTPSPLGNISPPTPPCHPQGQRVFRAEDAKGRSQKGWVGKDMGGCGGLCPPHAKPSANEEGECEGRAALAGERQAVAPAASSCPCGKQLPLRQAAAPAASSCPCGKQLEVRRRRFAARRQEPPQEDGTPPPKKRTGAGRAAHRAE